MSMIEQKDMEKLQTLSRIDMSDDEKRVFSDEIKAVLEYVSVIQNEASVEIEKEVGILHNIFRADDNPHKSGIYTEKILEEVPQREANYVKVKKIL